MIVESALRLRIGGEQNLEAAVEQEAFKFIGANATADAVRSLDDLERSSGIGEMPSAGETCKARTDD